MYIPDYPDNYEYEYKPVAVIEYCDHCGAAICDGDYYFDYEDTLRLCEHCANNHYRTAERRP